MIKVIYLLFILGLIFTISNAVNTIFVDFRNRFEHIQYRIIGDFVYIVFLVLFLMLVIYLYQKHNNIASINMQKTIKQLM